MKKPRQLQLLGLLVCLLFSGCAAYGPRRADETVYRQVRYTKSSEANVRLDLYVPKSSKPCPVVVWFHGGAWRFGHNGYHLLVRDLTRHGIAVASVEYRLLRHRNPWPDQLDDCRESIRWIRANGPRYGIDPKRLGVSGESAGGHLAALLALELKKPIVRGACLMYPPTDLVALGRRYEKFHRMSILSQMFRGEIEYRLSEAREASPVAQVSPQAPPFLIYHGDRDWLVPVEQSRALDARLKEAGVASELIVEEGRGHAFTLNREQVAHVAEFFRRQF